ncbi:MAG TPA: hypothetical protein VEX57_19220 [Microlunatus sp.]|jgi:hypothetical protein|nr:hypothetical protein [Microlunatus sp.]
MPATPTRPLLRLGLLLAAGLTVTGLTSCTSDSQGTQDAYKIGCPALDAAMAGGSVANQAAIRGLKAIRDSGQLDPEPAKWVDAALGALESADPADIPADARTLLVDGCAQHGYTLQNL